MPARRPFGFPAGSRWSTPSRAGGRSGQGWPGCAGWILARACRCARSRRIKGSGTIRAGTGRSTTGKLVGFESWVERGHLVALDFAAEVTAIVSQPFWLCWRTPAGKPARHAPDFFARLAGGGALVIDSRPRDVAGDEDRQAFAATRRACEVLGWHVRGLRRDGPGGGGQPAVDRRLPASALRGSRDGGPAAGGVRPGRSR